jgi:hypothetical protein
VARRPEDPIERADRSSLGLEPLVLDSTSVRAAVTQAVGEFWSTRTGAKNRQQLRRQDADRGTRSEVTSGKTMDGFARMVYRALLGAGVAGPEIHVGLRTSIPGYYRAEKRWDVVVVSKGSLRLAVELKSQVGSFGNNANNRLEEGIGNVVDARRMEASRQLGGGRPVWFGYLILLEDCKESNADVRVFEPHFPVDSDFRTASYASRYIAWCRRVQADGLYSSASFLMSPRGVSGEYSEPAPDLGVERFLASLQAFAAD